MNDIKPGILAMIYGLKIDVELNGRVVTVEYEYEFNNQYNQYMKIFSEFKNEIWWWCSDGNLYLTKNLMPIDNTNPDAEKTKDKEEIA